MQLRAPRELDQDSAFPAPFWTLFCFLRATICSNPFLPSENTEQRKRAAIMFTDRVGGCALRSCVLARSNELVFGKVRPRR